MIFNIKEVVDTFIKKDKNLNYNEKIEENRKKINELEKEISEINKENENYLDLIDTILEEKMPLIRNAILKKANELFLNKWFTTIEYQEENYFYFDKIEYNNTHIIFTYFKITIQHDNIESRYITHGLNIKCGLNDVNYFFFKNLIEISSEKIPINIVNFLMLSKTLNSLKK